MTHESPVYPRVVPKTLFCDQLFTRRVEASEETQVFGQLRRRYVCDGFLGYAMK